MNARMAIVYLCTAGIAVILGVRVASQWDDIAPDWIPEYRPRPLPQVGESRLAPHWTYALALDARHRLYAWGGSGDEGFPSAQGRAVEIPAVLDQGLDDWRYVSADIATSYAVTKDGQLLRRPMSLAAAQRDDPPGYTPVFPGRRWLKAQSVMRMTLGLTADGELLLWREQSFEERKSMAWPAAAGSDWADFCLSSGEGRRHEAYVLDREGKLFRLAFKNPRQDRYPGEAPTLTPLYTPTPFQRVYCAGSLVMLLDRDRRLWGFGDNQSGALSPELKAEMKRQRVTSYVIKDDAARRLAKRRWLAVAPGYGYSVGIASNGDLWAWGDAYGETILKDPQTPKDRPLLVDRDREWVEVQRAGGYLLARDSQGLIYTWGDTGHPDNPYVKGLLGDGGVAEHRDRPRPIVQAPGG